MYRVEPGPSLTRRPTCQGPGPAPTTPISAGQAPNPAALLDPSLLLTPPHPIQQEIPLGRLLNYTQNLTASH